MDNTPMTFEKFNYYMDEIRKEYDWRNAVSKLNIDITEHMDTFYYTIDLLSYIFHDTNGLIAEFIFEGDWGNDTYWIDIPDVPTLYAELITIHNNKEGK